MQKIEVAVQPECLNDVSESLRKAKIGPFRASAVTNVDPAAPLQGSYRGASYAIGRDRVRLELVVPDHEVESAIEAIREGIDAWGKGDTELLVLNIQNSVRLG
jgi:nitrogen regulatory protein P-II 1